MRTADMLNHAKNAAITTAIVLASIWVLRKLPVTRDIVDTAIRG